jgi:hypothetical protein
MLVLNFVMNHKSIKNLHIEFCKLATHIYMLTYFLKLFFQFSFFV